MEFISRYGGSTGSVLFKVVSAAILNFWKLLIFLSYLTNRHQNLWKHLDFDLAHIDDVRNAKFRKFKICLYWSHSICSQSKSQSFHKCWWPTFVKTIGTLVSLAPTSLVYTGVPTTRSSRLRDANRRQLQLSTFQLSLTILVRYRTRWHPKCIFGKFNMAVAAILNF